MAAASRVAPPERHHVSPTSLCIWAANVSDVGALLIVKCIRGRDSGLGEISIAESVK